MMNTHSISTSTDYLFLGGGGQETCNYGSSESDSVSSAAPPETSPPTSSRSISCRNFACSAFMLFSSWFSFNVSGNSISCSSLIRNYDASVAQTLLRSISCSTMQFFILKNVVSTLGIRTGWGVARPVWDRRWIKFLQFLMLESF